MTREFDARQFGDVYQKYICEGVFNEEPGYYPRYRARYENLIKRYCLMAPSTPVKILDVGGGQLGLLCNRLWHDHVWVADIGGGHLDYLKSQGIHTVKWNLCMDGQPFEKAFDVVFFSEVIEHLPIPGHIVLERLKMALRPGGMIICTTPNLYRLRNVVYLALGKPIFDYFHFPEDKGLGHVIEYSMDHLKWQMEKAGFENCRMEHVQMQHAPTNPVFRIMYMLGSLLFLIPRFRDVLIGIGRAPLA